MATWLLGIIDHQTRINMATAPLFKGHALSLHEESERLQRLLRLQAMDYRISFGIFRNKRGDDEHNVLIVVTDKYGKPHTVSLEAMDLRDMISKANEFLESL